MKRIQFYVFILPLPGLSRQGRGLNTSVLLCVSACGSDTVIVTHIIMIKVWDTWDAQTLLDVKLVA